MSRKMKIVEPQEYVHCDIDHCTASAAILNGNHPFGWVAIMSNRSAMQEVDLCERHSQGWIPMVKRRLSNEFDIIRLDLIEHLSPSVAHDADLIKRLEAL